jgi:leader peptidase (prepilin peptidase)/N-methyltransferase
MTGLGQPDWLFPVLAAPFVGSFLGLLIARLPLGGDVVFARSTCPSCHHKLGPADLVPVVSWLGSRGRCRHCGARISFLYPGVELAALVLAVWAATVVSGWLLWASCALAWCLLALAVIDWRHHLLPDVLTLPLIVVGLAVAYVASAAGIAAHLVGAAAGFVAFAAIAWAYRRLRGREGLGLGDAKLLAAAGAWISWVGLGSVVLIGAVTALGLAVLGAARGRGLRADTRLAFGPHLALGTWLVWLYGPLVIGG